MEKAELEITIRHIKGRLDRIEKALNLPTVKTSVVHKGGFNPNWYKEAEPSPGCEG